MTFDEFSDRLKICLETIFGRNTVTVEPIQRHGGPSKTIIVLGKKPFVITAARKDINFDAQMITVYLRRFDSLFDANLDSRNRLSRCVRQM
jgi:hypothetical protein